ncbi:hypothetical protein C8R47DRAFT_1072425 [Mycena vitilis]|nr:hypothetical protein C8R47DRAFT_1072425 [Mycena vitilis]
MSPVWTTVSMFEFASSHAGGGRTTEQVSQLLALGAPGEDKPVTRDMFLEQHSTLHGLMIAGESVVLRSVVSNQVWCQGVAGSSDGIIYVRVSRATVLDTSDLSSDSSDAAFASFNSEVPVTHGVLGVLVKGALLGCAVEMFRVDMPLQSARGIGQDVFTRAYALNAGRVVRFVRQTA